MPESRSGGSPRKSSSNGLPTWAAVTIALAGIAATLIGSLVAAAITGHDQRILQERNQQAQAADSDRTELRGVIDEAAVGIFREYKTVVNAQVATNSPGVSDAEKRRNLRASLNGLVPLEQSEARLSIRLGPSHPLTESLSLARAALFNATACLAKQGPHREIPGRDLYDAVDLFRAEAMSIARSRLGPAPQSTASQATGELGRLRPRIVSERGWCV